VNRNPIEQKVSRRPADDEGVVGDIAHVIAADGNYYGSFQKRRNWCGEEFWLEVVPAYRDQQSAL